MHWSPELPGGPKVKGGGGGGGPQNHVYVMILLYGLLLEIISETLQTPIKTFLRLFE